MDKKELQRLQVLYNQLVNKGRIYRATSKYYKKHKDVIDKRNKPYRDEYYLDKRKSDDTHNYKNFITSKLYNREHRYEKIYVGAYYRKLQEEYYKILEFIFNDEIEISYIREMKEKDLNKFKLTFKIMFDVFPFIDTQLSYYWLIFKYIYNKKSI
jgi:hypothetical protein